MGKYNNTFSGLGSAAAAKTAETLSKQTNDAKKKQVLQSVINNNTKVQNQVDAVKAEVGTEPSQVLANTFMQSFKDYTTGAAASAISITDPAGIHANQAAVERFQANTKRFERLSALNKLKQTVDAQQAENDATSYAFATQSKNFNKDYVQKSASDVTAFIEDGSACVLEYDPDKAGTTEVSPTGYIVHYTNKPQGRTRMAILNSDGTYEDITSVKDATVDYKKQVNEYLNGYNTAKGEYKKFYEVEQKAKKGAEYVQGQSDDHSTNTLIRLLTNATSLLGGFSSLSTSRTIRAVKNLTNEEQVANLYNSSKEYVQRGWTYQRILQHTSQKKWDALYRQDPAKATEQLLKADMDEGRKSLIAYNMLYNNGDTDAHLEQIGQRVLTELGEDVDLLANPVKAVTAWVYYQATGKNITDQDVSNMNVMDAFKSSISATWSNTGHKQFNYDTGCLPVDLVLEVVSDPESVAGIAAKGFEKSAVKGAVEIAEDGTGITRKALSKAWFSARHNTPDIESAIKRFTSTMPDETAVKVEEYLTKMVNKSKSYKIARSLNIGKEAAESVTKALSYCTGVGEAGYAIRKLLDKLGAQKAIKAITALDATDLTDADIKLKALADAMNELGGDIHAKDMIDLTNMNISALSIADKKAYAVLDEADKEALCYAQYLKDEQALLDIAERVDATELARARLEATNNLLDNMEALGLQDSKLYAQLDDLTSMRAQIAQHTDKALTYPRPKGMDETERVYKQWLNSNKGTIALDNPAQIDSKMPGLLPEKDFQLHGHVGDTSYSIIPNPSNTFDMVASNHTLNKIGNDLSDNTIAFYEMSKEFTDPRIGKDLKDFNTTVYNHTVGTHNWNVIKQVTAEIPDGKKLLNTLSSDKFVRAARSLDIDNYHLDAYTRNYRVHNYVRRIFNETYNFDARVHAPKQFYDLLAGIEKSTPKDALQLIEQHAAGFAADLEGCTPVYYHVVMSDIEPKPAQIHIRYDGETTVFDIPDTEVGLYEDFVQPFDELIQKINRANDNPVRFVGAHNGIKGNDVATDVARILTNGRSNYKNLFYNTYEVCENYMPQTLKYSDADFYKLEDAINSLASNYKYNAIKADALAGVKLRFSLTPMGIKDLDDLSVRAGKIAGNSTDATLQTYFKNIADCLQEESKQFYKSYKEWRKGLPKLVHGDDWKSIAGTTDLAVKKVYDADVYSRWYSDVAEPTVELMEFAKDCDTYKKAMWDKLFIDLSKYDIDYMFDEYVTQGNIHVRTDLSTVDKFSMLCAAAKHGTINFRPIATRCETLIEAVSNPWGTVLSKPKLHNTQLINTAASNSQAWRDTIELSDAHTKMLNTMHSAETIQNVYNTFGSTNIISANRKSAVGQWLKNYNKLDSILQRAAEDTEIPFTDYLDSYTRKLRAKKPGAHVDRMKVYMQWRARPSHYQTIKTLERTMSSAHLKHCVNSVLTLAQDGTQFTNYLATTCNGRLVIDLNCFDEATVGILHKWEKDLNFADVEHSIKDNKILLKYTGEVTEDMKNFKLEKQPMFKVSDSWRGSVQVRGEHNIEEFESKAKVLDNMLDLAQQYNPNTFSYGLPIANTAGTYSKVLEFFGEEATEDMLKGMNFKGYCCSYIGNVGDLRSPQNFISNSYLTNMFNAYRTVGYQIDVKANTLRRMFYNGETINDYLAREFPNLHTSEVGKMDADMWLKKGQYKLGWLTEDAGEFKLNKFTPQNMEQVLQYGDRQGVIIMDKEVENILDDMLTQNNPVKVDTAKTSKILEKYQQIRSKYIQGYLFINPGTWVHNYIDSTLKATMSEGLDHLYYMKKTGFGSWVDKFVDESAKLRAEGIEALEDMKINLAGKFGWTERDVELLWEYCNTTVSGKQWDWLNAVKKIGDMEESRKFNPLSKYMDMNAEMFGKAEDMNRFAIYYQHRMSGGSVQEAYNAVKKSQFDYSKEGIIGKIDTLFPFSTFKIYNYKYWLSDMVEDGLSNVLGDLSTMYDTDTMEDEYWTDSQLSYRAMLDYLFADQPQQDREYYYDSLRDYMGADKETALEQGWVRITDKLYFKSGMSLIDAISGLEYLVPVVGQWSMFKDNVFAPIPALVDMIKGFAEIAQDPTILTSGTNHSKLTQWWANHGSNVFSMLPILGTVYYRAYSTGRLAHLTEQYGNDPQLIATMCMSDLFAWANQDGKAKPIDEMWYMNGLYVRDVMSWLQKDPATYYNLFGTLQDVYGLDYDDAMALIDEFGNMWKDEEGIHSFNMIVGNADHDDVINKLVALGHWNRDKAEELWDELSNRPESWGEWKNYTGWTNYYRSGWKNWNSKWNYNYYSYNYQPYAYEPTYYNLGTQYVSKKKPHVNNDRPRFNQQIRALSSGRNNLRHVHWHHRQRDIYNDLYAKYGASRMAMRQNPRAYSNRSITEMYRENQKLAYSKIHRHNTW